MLVLLVGLLVKDVLADVLADSTAGTGMVSSPEQPWLKPSFPRNASPCPPQISNQKVALPGPGQMQRAAHNSSSSAESWYPGLHRLLLEMLLIAMCLGALTGNMLVISIIAAMKRFHSVTSAFIINLAISDCLVGLGTMSFVAMSVLYDDWKNINELCVFVGYTSSVYCTASVLSVSAIALDRYWTIVDCLRYETPRTTKRTMATIIWIWLQATLSNIPPLLGWGRITYVPAKYTCTTDWSSSTGYAVFFAAFSVFLPMSIMIFCYLKMISIARGHTKRIQDLENQLRRNSIRTNASEVEKPTCSKLIYFVNCKLLAEAYYCDTQSISSYLQDMQSAGNLNRDLSEHDYHERQNHGRLRLLLVMVVFTCCWIPYVIVNLIQAMEKTSEKKVSSIPSSVITAAYWLTLFNSDMNPVLYALLSDRFQKVLCNLCHKLHTSDGFSFKQEHPSFQRRRTSSNVTGISTFVGPADQASAEENPSADHSSLSSDNSEHSDGSVRGECPDSPSSSSASSFPKVRVTESARDGVILKPKDLPDQFLQVPSLSPWKKANSLSLSPHSVSKKSSLVCGQITITVDCDGD